jgi:hypothetical protein
MYTAVIVEPRVHNALPFVLKNFDENLPDEWSILVIHGTENNIFIKDFIKNSNITRIQTVELNIKNLTTEEYSNLLKSKNFYNFIKTETFLIFQVDTLIIPENKNNINDFLEYDYVGAPWGDNCIGNGGLSLRKKSKMLEIIEKCHPDFYNNEDEFFTKQFVVPLHKPSFEKSKKFSVETVFYENPFGVHKFYEYLSPENINILITKYPILQEFVNLNKTVKNPVNFPVTIVYKTYKNDLEWLKYSLLSLLKYLDFSFIFEIIIYTHDVVCYDVNEIIDFIKLRKHIHVRVIPVHYNYHGYIKQQVVKLSCYEDCFTKYILLLDSDLLLKKPFNPLNMIKNEKIEWAYLPIENDPNNHVFSVWKTAYKNITKLEKNVHYMSNGFPFIFTKKSMEEAYNKFIELNGMSYEDYCLKRCTEENININQSTKEIFGKLSTIFTEFEYIGFFCHHFSQDYIFYPIQKCKMSEQCENYNTESYFIQNWSHGGMNENIKSKIQSILEKSEIIQYNEKKTIIFVWSQAYSNIVSDNTNNFFGLGDILRGTISMYQYSKKYNFRLIVDTQLHPISMYLKVQSHDYSELVKQKQNDISFVYPDKIDNFLKTNPNDLTLVFSNSYLISNITEDCKNFIKMLLTPKDEFKQYINGILESKPLPINHSILHFRLGDSLMIRGEQKNFDSIIQLMNKYKENTDVLMSDSERFKEHLMINFNDIFLYHINIGHIGYKEHSSIIRDSLFEFFIIIMAKKIKTYSIYGWISGFVKIAHDIYDVPLEVIQ